MKRDTKGFICLGVWLGLWGCSRSEVTHEITVTERPVAAVVDAVKPLAVVSLGEEVRVCAETGGEACERLLGRRAEVEAGGEVSKQAWVEALMTGCVRGRIQEVCVGVMKVLANHKAEGVDAAAVLASARAACEGGERMACVMVANSFTIHRSDLEVRNEDAADYFAKACRLGEKPSCVMAADMYVEMVSDSPHGERVLGEAKELVRGPCDAGDFEACTVLSLAMVSEQIPEAKRDLVRARELARKACDGKWSAGCNLYAEMALLGLGGQRDIEGGAKLFEEVCAREVVDDATETACRSMAFLHTGRMEILPVDAVKARGYAKRACEVLAKLRADADCFVAREVEELLGEGAPRAVVEP